MFQAVVMVMMRMVVLVKMFWLKIQDIWEAADGLVINAAKLPYKGLKTGCQEVVIETICTPFPTSSVLFLAELRAGPSCEMWCFANDDVDVSRERGWGCDDVTALSLGSSLHFWGKLLEPLKLLVHA